jgi:glutamate racemase
VAVEVHKILSNEGLLNEKGKGRRDFFVSDNPEWFSNLASRFLGAPVKNVKKVSNV